MFNIPPYPDKASEENESIDHYRSAQFGGVGLIDAVLAEACAIAYPIEQIALGSRTTGRNPQGLQSKLYRAIDPTSALSRFAGF